MSSSSSSSSSSSFELRQPASALLGFLMIDPLPAAVDAAFSWTSCELSTPFAGWCAALLTFFRAERIGCGTPAALLRSTAATPSGDRRCVVARSGWRLRAAAAAAAAVFAVASFAEVAVESLADSLSVGAFFLGTQFSDVVVVVACVVCRFSRIFVNLLRAASSADGANSSLKADSCPTNAIGYFLAKPSNW